MGGFLAPDVECPELSRSAAPKSESSLLLGVDGAPPNGPLAEAEGVEAPNDPLMIAVPADGVLKVDPEAPN